MRLSDLGRRTALLFASMALSMGALAASGTDGACIAPLTYVPLDVATVGADAKGLPALGSYERISPDGRFILRSYSGAKLGQVSLIELPANPTGQPRAYATPLSNEAFPVQGTWRYLVDVNGDHYRFRDVLQDGAAARPLFRGGVSGFYATAAEMPPKGAAAGAPVYVRSLSWPQGGSFEDRATGPLQMATLEIADDGHAARVVRKIGPSYMCGDRASTDGDTFALPMLSVDGTEFSAIPQSPRVGQPSMRVYRVSSDAMSDDRHCALETDLGFTASKAVFGFPGQSAGRAWLTYSDVGNVYVFDAALQLDFALDHGKPDLLASAFPGITRDGRVVYAATWRDCDDAARCAKRAGYVVADPYQSSAYRAYWKTRRKEPAKACITADEVAAERARFARFHGIAP